MPRQVTVNLFDVDRGDDTPALTDVIEMFEGLPLEQRWRDDIRLDAIEPTNVEGRRVVMLEFAKKREIGPGKVADDRAIDDIHMARDENFGEETAAMYVPSKTWLLILHNQAGVGPNRIMGYFNAVDPGNVHYAFEAKPVIDPSALRTLQRMGHISSVEVTANIDALNASQRDVGVSMARAVRPAGAQRISFQLMANARYMRGRELNTDLVKDLVGRLREVPGDDAVTALKVKGGDPDSDRDIMLDLIHHRVKRRFREDELEVLNHRFTIQSRWNLLARAFRQWHNIL